MEWTSELERLRTELAQTSAKIWRRLRLARVNHNLLVFLVFLCVSICFWFLQVFKESASVSVEYELCIINVPKNIIFTSQVPKTVTVNVNGRGFAVLEYLAEMKTRRVEVDFSEFATSGGLATLNNVLLRRAITKNLGSGIKLVSSAPQTLELYYSKGEHKRVPVVFAGRASSGPLHLVCGINTMPDSVDVYAPIQKLDSVSVAYTESVVYKNLEDSLCVRMALQTVRGVKFVPDSVEVNVGVDLFSEKTIQLPIYCENIPQNKVLRTFPLRASVTFHVSAARFNSISEDDFALVVDYNSIKEGDKRCKLIMRSQPDDITHLRISPETVEYIIEQVEE